MKNKLHFLFLIGLVTLLTGCSFGGDYKAPISKNIGEELQCSEYEKYTVIQDKKYISSILLINFLSNNSFIIFSPSPSMFIASLDTK